MRRLVFEVVLVAVLVIGSGPALGTEVGGLICSDTTWDVGGSPYVVTDSIVIGCGATLTIEAEVVVEFDPQLAIVVGSASYGEGTLAALGTEESPIVFTSVKDPYDPLDPAAPGDWSRLHFTDYATDALFDGDGNYVSGCILEHVIVEYAGYGNYAAIFADKSSPLLSYCKVRHNSYHGITVDATGAPHINIVNCEVWDHPHTGIYIHGGAGHRLLDTNIHDNSRGVYFDDCASNTLSDNTIEENTGSNDGGGIYLYRSGDNTLTGNTITDNTGSGDGGGIYADRSGGNTFTGNTITGNTAGSYGGGIYFSSSSDSNTVTGNTITGNTASGAGGGICFYSSGGNTVSNNTITGNTAGADGGGIYFYWSGGNIVTGNTITGNTASSNGGGICFSSNSDSNTLTGNTITENTTGGDGGGIYFYSGGSNTVTGNTIRGNTAGYKGGGIYLSNSDNNEFSSNLIRYNHTDLGETGGIYVTGDTNWLSLAGDPVGGTYNVICCNDGYQIYNNNPFYADGRNDVDASYVQWGTNDMGEIQDLIYDYGDDATKAFVVCYPFVESIGLLSSDPPVDGTLAKIQNNVLLLEFECAIGLPVGPALSIVPIGGAGDVGDLFTYTLETTVCPDDTLKAKEDGEVLANMVWYEVTPTVELLDLDQVQPFTLEVCTLGGDADGDGQVLAFDYFGVKNNMFEQTDARYDLDGDGQVLAFDYFVVKNHMFDQCPPKP